MTIIIKATTIIIIFLGLRHCTKKCNIFHLIFQVTLEKGCHYYPHVRDAI